MIRPARPIRVCRLGRIAHAALRAEASGAASPATLNGFHRINGEYLWIGVLPAAMHPRAVVVDASEDTRAEPSILDITGAAIWHAPAVTCARRMSKRAWKRLGHQLLGKLSALGPGEGFGRLLTGREVGFPLCSSVAAVKKLARAYRRDSPPEVYEASLALLGAGPGLTPSGDDLAGAALFARRLLPGFDSRWDAVAKALAKQAKRLSHPISAALFADLAAGESFEALHALADGEEDAWNALRRLAGVGHSSGWDMLTGYAIGAGWPLPAGQAAV